MNYFTAACQIQHVPADLSAHVASFYVPASGIPRKELVSKLEKLDTLSPAATTASKRNVEHLVNAFDGYFVVTRNIVAGSQGSIFGDDSLGEQSTNVAMTGDAGTISGGSANGSSAGRQTPSIRPGATLIEQSALANVELQAERERSVALEGIAVADDLAHEAALRVVSAEEVEARLSSCPDPRIARAAYHIARTEGRIDAHFLDQQVSLGGRRPIPAKVYSERMFSLKGCVLLTTDKQRIFRINPSHDDPGWRQLQRAFPRCERLEVPVDHGDLPFLQEAVVSGQSLDLDICVALTVSNDKRVAVPLKVNNRHELRDAGLVRLERMNELLMDHTGTTKSLFD